MKGMHKYFRLLIAVGVFALALAILVPVMDHVVLNGTPSVKAHVLWKTPRQAISKGDYVMAPARHPYIPPQYKFLTKRALCVGGDRLSYSQGAFFCNGVKLSHTKTATKSGAPLNRFDWLDGVVPDSYVFIGSAHPDGFDSRYLGLFRVDELTRLEPVL